MGRKSRMKKEARLERQEEGPKISSVSSPFLRIALTFAAFVVGFQLIPGLFVSLLPLQLWVASLVGGILVSTGLPATVQGIELFMPKAHWVVIGDCTAISAIILFISFILAYPSSKKAKVIAAVVGIPGLFLINIFRLVMLAWLTEWNPKVGEYFHDFIWQLGFLVLVVCLWMVWIEKVVKHETKAALPC